MSKTSNFVEIARTNLAKIEGDLSELEAKVAKAGRSADSWAKDQAAKLKADWKDVQSKVTDLADQMENEGEDAISDAQTEAQRHWDALKAAVTSYRSHLEEDVDA